LTFRVIFIDIATAHAAFSGLPAAAATAAHAAAMIGVLRWASMRAQTSLARKPVRNPSAAAVDLVSLEEAHLALLFVMSESFNQAFAQVF